MPLKRKSKAVFILMIILYITLLYGSAYAEVCAPSVGKTCYQYDEQNRLKRADYPNGSYIKYDFDKLGNIIFRETHLCATNANTTNTACTQCTGANQTCVEAQATWQWVSWEAWDCWECWDYGYECDDYDYPICYGYDLISYTPAQCTTTTTVCPPTCGNGTCESGETSSTCPADCSVCTTTTTTNTDCTQCTGSNQSCVEGQCTWQYDSWEAIEYYDCYECWDYNYECDESNNPPLCWTSYLSCNPDLCTTTTAVCPPICGNGICETGETSSTCPADCGSPPSGCGDGWCDCSFETPDNCSEDCGDWDEWLYYWEC